MKSTDRDTPSKPLAPTRPVTTDRERRPERDDAPMPPVIHRRGIRWSGGAGSSRLRIALDFENPGLVPSRPASAAVEWAPFGAFLPWRSLTNVEIPEIDGAGIRTVTAEVPAPRAGRSGSGGGAADLRAAVTRSLADQREPGRPTLPDLPVRAELRTAHWMGSLRVIATPDRSVERHLSRAVGLLTGAPNEAAFALGDGRPDAYSFLADTPSAQWRVYLSHAGRTIAPAEWIQLRSARIRVEILPPPRIGWGKILVHVTRHSTRELKVVEFDLRESDLTQRFRRP